MMVSTRCALVQVQPASCPDPVSQIKKLHVYRKRKQEKDMWMSRIPLRTRTAWTSEFAQSCTSISTVMSQCQQIWPSCVLASFPSLPFPPKPKRFPSYQRPTAAANTDKGRPLKRSHLLILSQRCALWANRLLSLICAAVDFRECHTETHGLESDSSVGQVT